MRNPFNPYDYDARRDASGGYGDNGVLMPPIVGSLISDLRDEEEVGPMRIVRWGRDGFITMPARGGDFERAYSWIDERGCGGRDIWDWQ